MFEAIILFPLKKKYIQIPPKMRKAKFSSQHLEEELDHQYMDKSGFC